MIILNDNQSSNNIIIIVIITLARIKTDTADFAQPI